MVWLGARLGFVAETENLLLWRRLEYDFLACLLLCLASYFSFFVVLFILFSFFPCIPVCFIFFVSLCAAAICYSQQVPGTYEVFYSTCSFCLLCHLCPTPCRNSLVFNSSSHFFSQLLFLGWRFFCCALVPGTLALDLPTLILQGLVFLCLAVCDHRICIYDEESGRTLGVMLMSWIGTTV